MDRRRFTNINEEIIIFPQVTVLRPLAKNGNIERDSRLRVGLQFFVPTRNFKPYVLNVTTETENSHSEYDDNDEAVQSVGIVKNVFKISKRLEFTYQFLYSTL